MITRFTAIAILLGFCFLVGVVASLVLVWVCSNKFSRYETILYCEAVAISTIILVSALLYLMKTSLF